MGIAITALQTVLAVLFLATGLAKVGGNAHLKEEFEKFGYPLWLMMLAGIMETVAAAAMIAWFWIPVAGVAGAWLVVPVMAGATYTNFVKRPPAYGWGMLVVFSLCLTVAVYRAVELFGWPR